jgi:tetratricopeptide (TPR) repeat protein
VAIAQQRFAAPTPAALAPSWTRPVVPSADDVVRLTREVRANPLGRDGWNRLSEALAARKEWTALLDLARRWQGYDPENPQVYECWGEAALALGRKLEAQRAFGSLVEVAPGKPELLQRAGLLLFRAGATSLAEAPLRQALKIRPDRANASRHLALVLWRTGRHAEAARVLEEACAREFPGWYLDVHRVLTEELGLVYRDWIARTPEKRSEIERRARERGIDLARRDALRVTLAWETDANDVDLHVVDPSGEECFFSHRQNASGLELYEDVTQGLGPEVVRTTRVAPGVYSVGVNYFAAGPMGVARGILVVVRDDGKPGAEPSVEILPFRLVPEGRDMKLLARIETGRGVGKR